MAQPKSRRWTVVAAAVAGLGISWTAAASAADPIPDAPTPEARAGAAFAGDLPAALGAELDPRIHTLFLPQILRPDDHAGRSFKKSTLFQVDGPLPFGSGDGDVLLRVQAKSRRLVYIEFRF